MFSRFQEYQRRTRIPTPLYGKLYLAPGSQDNQSPIFLSEFGGIGFILPDEHSWVPENSWGYSGVEPTEAAAMQRLRGLFVAVARIPEIAGVCYTQLYDVEQEVNGLLTYGRRPKFPIDAIREVVNLLDG